MPSQVPDPQLLSQLNRAIFTRESKAAARVYRELLQSPAELKLRPVVQYDLARLLELGGELELALSAYEKLIRSGSAAGDHLGPALKQGGQVCFRLKKYESCAEYLARFLDSNPSAKDRNDAQEVLSHLPPNVKIPKPKGEGSSRRMRAAITSENAPSAAEAVSERAPALREHKPSVEGSEVVQISGLEVDDAPSRPPSQRTSQAMPRGQVGAPAPVPPSAGRGPSSGAHRQIAVPIVPGRSAAPTNPASGQGATSFGAPQAHLAPSDPFAAPPPPPMSGGLPVPPARIDRGHLEDATLEMGAVRQNRAFDSFEDVPIPPAGAMGAPPSPPPSAGGVTFESRSAPIPASLRRGGPPSGVPDSATLAAGAPAPVVSRLTPVELARKLNTESMKALPIEARPEDPTARYLRLRTAQFALLIPFGKRIHIDAVAELVAQRLEVDEAEAKRVVISRKGIILDQLTINDVVELSPAVRRCRQQLIFVHVDRSQRPYELFDVLGAEALPPGLKMTTEKGIKKARWSDVRMLSVGTVGGHPTLDVFSGVPIRQYRFAEGSFNFRTIAEVARSDPRRGFEELARIIALQAPRAPRSQTFENYQRRPGEKPQLFATTEEFDYYNRWVLFSYYAEVVDDVELASQHNAMSNW